MCGKSMTRRAGMAGGAWRVDQHQQSIASQSRCDARGCAATLPEVSPLCQSCLPLRLQNQVSPAPGSAAAIRGSYTPASAPGRLSASWTTALAPGPDSSQTDIVFMRYEGCTAIRSIALFLLTDGHAALGQIGLDLRRRSTRESETARRPGPRWRLPSVSAS
jgi:hypothetical protein